MKFFLKTGQKKCCGLAILLSDFGYLGPVTCEIIAFWTSHLIPNLRWPYLDICSFFWKFSTLSSWVSSIKKVMMILIWCKFFLNESKKMPWTSYMVFGTSPLIPSLGWPYLDICSFFEIFRPSSSWVIYNLKGIKRDKNSLNVKTFNI